MKFHKINKEVIVIICFILIIAVFFIIKNIQNRNSIKIGSISTKNIASFKISDVACHQKDVSNKAEREKIINLINSIGITRYNAPVCDGVGYGVEITYSNGKKFSASFLSGTVAYSNNDGRVTCCNIDKDIVDDLRECYDENCNMKANEETTK